MVQGKRNAEIALERDLTESTVRTARAKLMAKLRLQTDIAPARRAMDCGLIPPAGDGGAFRSNRFG